MALQPCECGSLRFRVQAVYSAVDTICLHDDGSEDFDVEDVAYGDGEWEEHGSVTCCECGKVMEYGEWSNQDEKETV